MGSLSFPMHSRTFGESIRTPAPAPARFTFGSSYKTTFCGLTEWWRIKPLTYHDRKLRRVSNCKEIDITEVRLGRHSLDVALAAPPQSNCGGEAGVGRTKE